MKWREYLLIFIAVYDPLKTLFYNLFVMSHSMVTVEQKYNFGGFSAKKKKKKIHRIFIRIRTMFTPPCIN